MRRSPLRRRLGTASGALLAASLAVAACSGGSAPTPSSGSGGTVALGTNNPAQGDCSANLSEAAVSVGSVVMTLTPSSFGAEIRVTSGAPNTTLSVFMQQVPGSCPQQRANGGTLVTDASGHGQATASVPRVPGATTFFVQLVPVGSGPGQYTSDRITALSP